MAKPTEYAPRPDHLGNRPVEKKVDPPFELKPKQLSVEEDERMQKLERRRRIYVKRTGGYRKDLNDSDKALAERLSKDLNMTVAAGWLPIHIADYDNAPHQQNEPAPSPVEAMTKAVQGLVSAVKKE